MSRAGASGCHDSGATSQLKIWAETESDQNEEKALLLILHHFRCNVSFCTHNTEKEKS